VLQEFGWVFQAIQERKRYFNRRKQTQQTPATKAPVRISEALAVEPDSQRGSQLASGVAAKLRRAARAIFDGL
jgi:hypothetical protein